MTGQVRRRSLAEYSMPTIAKLADVEITQARDLGVERLSVRWCGTDLYARHGAQGVRLKRLVADLSLEKQVLKDIASGNL